MIQELRVGNYVAYKGKPSLVCALDYYPKLRKENISVVYKWGEPPYKTNGVIQPILLTEKLVLQCGFNQLDDYTFDNDEMEITQDWDDQTVYYITTHANEYTVSGHRIEYLHQLQNAYFCLSGGKELEVNL